MSSVAPPGPGTGVATTVLVVDDHHLVRRGVSAAIGDAPAMRVVGEASTAAGALACVRLHEPDVVVLDLSLPDARGASAIEAIAAADPRLRILVLSVHDDAERVLDAYASGADGYIPKGAPDGDIPEAIATVMRGERYVHPALGGMLARSGRRVHRDQALSARETEVLRLSALGHGSSEIGGMLCISPRTVEAHRTHAMAKLGLRSRVEIVAYARRVGLMRPEPEPL